jgi:antitoxin ParD1/3/4
MPRSIPMPALDGRSRLKFISAMTVTLTTEQEQFVTEQMADGHYHSPGEVITQSLGLLRAQEEFIRDNVMELREKISTGLEQIRRGETVDGPAAIRNLREKLQQRERGGQ